MLRTIGDVNLPDGVNEGSELAVFVHTDEGVTGCSVGAGNAEQSLPALIDLVIDTDPPEVTAFAGELKSELLIVPETPSSVQ